MTVRMPRIPAREFWCPVVSEPVVIRVTRPSRMGRPATYFIQCDQRDCQYVEVNAPPCPLHVDMFGEEIRAAEAARNASRAAMSDADQRPAVYPR
jgi:hypothetical protein